MIELEDALLKDLESVKQIDIVPNMLEVICRTTGMGFAAVARVTQERWLACSVRDEVQFGLAEGDELEIKTTLCNEIRDSRKPIVIDHVAEDPDYKNHHTPQIYGLQSYISVPIILRDGTFFGTLCAIDAKPAKVNNKRVIGTLTMFADLLAFHLQSLDLLERSYQTTSVLHNKNQSLSKINDELDSFVYTASHDLKSPIHNIESLVNVLSDTVAKETLDRAKIQQIVGLMKLSLKRLGLTIKDLATVVEVDEFGSTPQTETVDLFKIVEAIKQDLEQQLISSNAKIELIIDGTPKWKLSKKFTKSILHNLLSNAIKYRSPGRQPQVLVHLAEEEGKVRLTVSDNGLGIQADKLDKIFGLYHRVHDHVEGSGIGLFIVKRMVTNMGGQISVNSTLGQGTTFTLFF